jgi:hypothetical protein
MELTNDIINSLSGQCKRDKKLATMIARDLLAKVEPLQVARLIFDARIAEELLVKHVQGNLAHTVAFLTGEVETKKKRGRPVVKILKSGSPSKTKRSKVRLSDDEVGKLKKAVCSFLKKKPGSSRATIQDAVEFPSLGIYNRIMKELVKSKAIKQKGQRRMAVYQ